MIRFMLNGRPVHVDVAFDTPLLWMLRDDLGFTGTKFGCGKALCGNCTVYLDGQPARACVLPVSAAAGKNVTTIEGLETRAGKAIQAAWQKIDVPQCGFCQPGQVMAAAALLDANPHPSDADIDAAMGGMICRCGTYGRIRAAIHEAAKSLS